MKKINIDPLTIIGVPSTLDLAKAFQDFLLLVRKESDKPPILNFVTIQRLGERISDTDILEWNSRGYVVSRKVLANHTLSVIVDRIGTREEKEWCRIFGRVALGHFFYLSLWINFNFVTGQAAMEDLRLDFRTIN